VSEYSEKMIEQIDKVRVKCVESDSAVAPVQVSGSAKECLNRIDSEGISRVVCDLKRFYSGLKDPENDAVQYKIVHHELATLAGFETPDRDNSQYPLSNQIAGFLENQVIKKLVVKSRLNETVSLQDRQTYAYGAPGADGHWRTDGVANGSDYEGFSYFDTINQILVPLRGKEVNGRLANTGTDCSIKSIGYELIPQSGKMSRGIYHIQYSENQTMTDFYLNRAEESGYKSYFNATPIKNPIEGNPYDAIAFSLHKDFLSCEQPSSSPFIVSCTRVTESLWGRTYTTCIFDGHVN
jgi:hypothetical protein